MSEDSKDYFFLIYLHNLKENSENNEIRFNSENQSPLCIYKKTLEEENDKTIFIFKFSIGNYKNKKNCNFDFSYGEKDYKITLDLRDKTFIFSPILIQNTSKIEQNKIEYADKMNYFKKSLENENEINKLNILYKDAIKLFSAFSNFQLLINIFINIYNSDLCSILLNEFSKLRTNDKLLEKEFQNKDSEIILNYLDDIFKDKENLVSSKSLNKIDFYGLILSIYNNCFNVQYEEKFNDLLKNDKNALFEVLLKYKIFLKNQINLKKEVLNGLIKFVSSKDFKEFKDNGLFYLKNINIFLEIINGNKEEIILIKNFQTIDIIQVENTEKVNLKNLVRNIDDILKFCEIKKILFINFNDNFWKTMVKHFSGENKENIELCYKFNIEFEKYENLKNFLENEKSKKNQLKVLSIVI